MGTHKLSISQSGWYRWENNILIVLIDLWRRIEFSISRCRWYGLVVSFVWLRLVCSFCFSISEAVCARCIIDWNRFEDFFPVCLRRTLDLMLCDIQREGKRLLKNNSGQRLSSLSSAALLGGNATGSILIYLFTSIDLVNSTQDYYLLSLAPI